MTRFRANLLLLLAALFWGIGNVAQKTILDDLGPTLSFGLRSLIGLVVICPLVVREIWRAQPLKAAAWRGITASAALFCVALALQQRAYEGTSVTSASFLINTTVVFTPFFAWIVIRERPRPVVVPAVVMTLGGVALMGGGLNGFGRGDALCLASAVFYALWIVFVARVTHTSGRPFTLAAAQFGMTALLGTAVGLLLEPVSAAALAGAAPELLVLGVFSTGVGFTLQALAQRATPAADAAIILSGESLFGAVAAAMVLGERMTPAAGLGAVLVLGAILLVQMPGFRVMARRGRPVV